MNAKELFRNIMNYKDFDRMPVWHWGGWPETYPEWEKQGYPKGARGEQELDYFQAEGFPKNIPLEFGLFPAFEPVIFEETSEFKIYTQHDGVKVKTWKNQSSIPHHIDYLLKERKDWEKHYLPRLQPDEKRFPSNLSEICKARNSGTSPVCINVASMIGWIRDWVGVEEMAFLSMDDPDLIGEMANTLADLTCWYLERVLPQVQVDMAWGWEDICSKSGPLVSPATFAKQIVPGYKKISSVLRKYGCNLYMVDSDGVIDHLLPHWIDGGVNVMFPIEVGVWDADPMVFRKKYGRDLRLIGGINKLVLEKGRKEIDAEIERRKPLMAEGGFIPMPDHLITPATPLENYKYYLDQMRELRF